MEFEASQAQIQRDYETEMSNSAVTRATQDMINAGINPVLAAGASASTPTVGIASGYSSAGSMAKGSKADVSETNQALALVSSIMSSAAKIAKG